MIKKSYLKIGIVVSAVCLLLTAVIGFYCHQKAAEASKDGKFAMDFWWPEYEDLISESDLIVVAKVTNEQGIWGTSDGKKPSLLDLHLEMMKIYRTSEHAGEIKTEYTYEPVTVLKGNTSDFKGCVYGGTVDGFSYTTDDVIHPSFKVGDNVLLFLTLIQKEDGTVISWWVSEVNSFTDNGDGTFSNVKYGTVTVDQVKEDIKNLQ